MDLFKLKQSLCVNMKIENAKKEGFDPNAIYSVVHSPDFYNTFGGDVMVVSHKDKSYFNLLVVWMLLVRLYRGG